MKYLVAPFFALWLSFQIFVFIAQVFWSFLAKYRAILSITLLILVIIIANFLNQASYQATPRSTAAHPILLDTLPKLTATFAIEASPTEIEHQYKIWQELANLQPTHRDVLINLGLMQWYLNQPDKALATWKKAQDLDPNSPVFKPTPLPSP